MMYGNTYAGIFYKRSIGQKPTEEMIKEATPEDELPSFNLGEL